MQPLIQKTTSNVATWFLRHIISRYGRPCVVRMDNGTEFAGGFSQLLGAYHITYSRSSVAYPQANGQAEQYIRTIKGMLRRLGS